MASVKELLERVREATGELDHRTALELHVMDVGKLTAFEPVTDRDEYGGYALTYQVDLKGGGRQKCTMPEDRLPDRCIDAALALTERLLPGALIEIRTGGKFHHCYIDGETSPDFEEEFQAENMPTAPLAILAALLTALSALKEAR